MTRKMQNRKINLPIMKNNSREIFPMIWLRTVMANIPSPMILEKQLMLKRATIKRRRKNQQAKI